MSDSAKHYLAFFGFPVAIILLGNVVIKLLYPVFREYAFIPAVLFYWVLTYGVVYFDSKSRNTGIATYLKETKFKVYLILLSILVGCLPLPIFILNIKSLNTPFLISTWIVVALTNPFFEEIFWRGYMIGHRAKMPFYIKSFYSSLLFTLSHVFIWGVVSEAILTKELIISVFIMGVAWSFIYQKSRSIVLPYFSHMLVDIFNLSVLAFMNLIPIAVMH